MALSAEQKAILVQITLRPREDIEAAATSLTAEEEALVSDEIDTWEPIKNSHVRLSGEVDFDNERKRQAIRARILVLLNLVSARPTFFGLASAWRGR